MRPRDLETGTWFTRDPIGYGDGPNVYCYVHCNPITKFDAFGLQSVVLTPWWAALGARPVPEMTVPKPRLQLPVPRPGGTIPKGLIDNPNRPGSWGRIGQNGKFKEVYRFDKGTPGKPGWKGIDHYHLNGEKPHIPMDTPYGIGPNGELVPLPVASGNSVLSVTATPEAATEATPESTPEAVPEAAPESAPEAVREVAPEATQEPEAAQGFDVESMPGGIEGYGTQWI